MTAESGDFENKRRRHKSGDSTVSGDSTRNIPTPPDGGWGWLVVLASFINHVVVDGISYTFSVFYLVFLDYFGDSKGKTALIGSLLTGFYLLTGPFASALVNKFGCRPVCVTGSIIACAAFMLSTFSTTTTHMMLTYGVMGGIGFGLIYLPSVISVSYYFEQKRALATGIAVCGAGVGCLIFAPIGPLLTDYYDWKSAMFIIAAVILNAFAAGMIFRPLDPPKKSRPRAKNILDRFKERWSNRNSQEDVYKEGEDENGHSPDESMMIQEGVKEAKLAREEMLRDDDSMYDVNSLLDSQTLLPNSRRQSENEKQLQQTNGDVNEKQTNGDLVVPTIQVDGEKEEEKEATHVMNGGMHPNGMKPPNGILRNKLLEKVMNEDSKRCPVPNSTSLPHGIFNSVQHSNGVDEKLTALLSAANDSREKSRSDHEVWSVAAPRNRSKKHARRPEGVEKMDYMRPMYRKDIFYSGSIRHIPQFQSQPDVKTYATSITYVPGAVPPERENVFWRCFCIPKSAKDTLKEMLDISLLKDPIFLIACLGEICAFIGLFVPFVYLVPRAIDLGVDKSTAAFLLSVVGITNTAGRVLSGALADLKCVNSLLLHNMALVFAGIACFCNMFCNSYPLMCVFSAFFGLCVATFIALTSIVLCDLIGLERLTNAFGLLTMVRGFSSIAGPPVAGFVYDSTNNYDISFHIGGVMLVISGFLYSLLHLPRFQKRITKMFLDDDVFPDLPVPELPKEQPTVEFQMNNEEAEKLNAPDC